MNIAPRQWPPAQANPAQHTHRMNDLRASADNGEGALAEQIGG
jgi:hypothetical protein